MGHHHKSTKVRVFFISRLLQCGHTFCQSCLISLLTQSQKKQTDFFCPNCMTKHKDIIDESNITSLIKNYNLLRIVEKLEVRRTATKQSSKEHDDINENENDVSKKIRENTLSNKKIHQKQQKNDEEDNIFISSYNINNEQKDKLEKIEKLLIDSVNKTKESLINKQKQDINNNVNMNNAEMPKFKSIDNIDPEQKCKKHDSVVVAYVLGTNMLYCEKCIAESPMKVSPLPSVLKDMRKKNDSSRLTICILKHEINRLFEFFESYQEEFEKSNKQKIDDLFSYLYKIISYNYNTSIQILRQCKGEQKTQIDQRILELTELDKELEEITQALNNIQKTEDKDLLLYYNNLNDIYERVLNFINYESELSLLTMKIGLKNEVKQDIFQIIQDSYFVDVEFANIQGQTPTIKHILQKTQFWSCFCGELNNPIEEILCTSCIAFRRCETFENFFSNPLEITAEDLKLLVLRRKTESKMFQDMIKETDSLLSTNKPFFVIEIEWFLLWKCFVTNDLGEKNLSNNKKKISINKNIGKFFV